MWGLMADKTESELDTVEQAVYHDVDDNELSMLLRVHQNNGRALPLGSFTERKISQVVHGATGVAPTALTLLGPDEVLLEFEKEASVVQVGIAVHALADWDDLKERLFHGVNQQTRDSMRFLYSKSSTTYDTLLSAIKEAEIEWLESKGQACMKAATIVDRSDEIEDLRKRLDHITATMKSNNYNGARPKRDKKESPTGSGSGSPRRKEDVRKNLKGPATSAAGPFRPDQSNFQCHKCGGWGHGWRECATKGNVDWAKIRGESEPKENKTVPEKEQQ